MTENALRFIKGETKKPGLVGSVFFLACAVFGTISTAACTRNPAAVRKTALIPVIDGEWWDVTGNPADHPYATERQEPVDFAVWQAADGSWQMWSCFRKTTAGGKNGKTRFFYRWEGKHPTDTDWAPIGVAMEAEPELGETPGGLQAPYVVKVDGLWHMFYGDWVNICHAVSRDGKTFARVVQEDGRTGMFSEGPEANTRDVMLLEHQGLWYAFYTGRSEGTFGVPGLSGKVWVRTTRDFEIWSGSKIVSFGGQAGTGNGSSECPFVVKLGDNDFYLFKTQTYGDYDRDRDDIRHRGAPRTSVYYSQDPEKFGINQDEEFFIGHLPVAAPEIVLSEGQYYIFALKQGSLEGMRCAKLKWVISGP
jgi:hypothetical protein